MSGPSGTPAPTGASIGVRNSPAGSVEEKRCGPSRTPAPTGCVHRGAPENKDRKRKNNFLMWTEKGNRRGPRRGRGEGEV